MMLTLYNINQHIYPQRVKKKKINVYILKHQVFSKLNEEDSLLLITNIHGIDSNLVKDIKCNNLYILIVRVISIHII